LLDSLLQEMKFTSVLSNVPKRLRYTLSNFFQPFDIIPHNLGKNHCPQEESVSARLLISYGFVKHGSPGTYHLLPLGLRVQNKLENLIDSELRRIGCHKISMPLLTQGSLWKKSGRLDSMGPELITFQDRHNRLTVLSPTHEESITNLIASMPYINSSSCPIRLYQTGVKFRDEMRPKFGLIRANEFTMNDLYTFDTDSESAMETYQLVTSAYNKIFTRLNVPYVVVAGDTGQIGGSISHEYHFPAPIGQDTLQVCQTCGFGANVELGEREECKNCGGRMIKSKGIEVGHTFLLGKKYSKPFGAQFQSNCDGKRLFHMGCYGIGVSRVLAASVEVLSSETELRWPHIIAPFTVAILRPKNGSKEEVAARPLIERIIDHVEDFFEDDFVIDDRQKLTVGRKLREARKTGYPYIILFGKKCMEPNPKIEIHDLSQNAVHELSPEDVLNYMDNARRKSLALN